MGKNNAMQAQEKVSRKLRTKQDSGETLLAFFFFFALSPCFVFLLYLSTPLLPFFFHPRLSLSLSCLVLSLRQLIVSHSFVSWVRH